MRQSVLVGEQAADDLRRAQAERVQQRVPALALREDGTTPAQRPVGRAAAHDDALRPGAGADPSSLHRALSTCWSLIIYIGSAPGRRCASPTCARCRGQQDIQAGRCGPEP
jgi:hypothetical protein